MERNIRAREIDDILKQHGFERGTSKLLTHVIERINDLEKSQTIQMQLIDRMSSLMTDFATVAGNMKTTIDSMKQEGPPNGQLPGAN